MNRLQQLATMSENRCRKGGREGGGEEGKKGRDRYREPREKGERKNMNM